VSSPQQIPEGRQAAKPSIGDVILRTILEEDVAAAIRGYRRLKAESPDACDFGKERLNELGLDLVGKGRIKDAIEIFRLNVEAYPRVFNTYDSLGYACMCDGRKELAAINYKKSVELNPDNQSTLVVGPWLHGGWASMDGDALGNIRFGVKTGVDYREKVELPFFNFYLKDKGTLGLPEALAFETGTDAD